MDSGMCFLVIGCACQITFQLCSIFNKKTINDDNSDENDLVMRLIKKTLVQLIDQELELKKEIQILWSRYRENFCKKNKLATEVKSLWYTLHTIGLCPSRHITQWGFDVKA